MATERDEKTRTLHMIGNAHLDPVWLWRWQEGFQEAKATFRAVLDLMNQDPDFLFTSSSAALYEFVEENDPDLFAEIRARVQEGRWEIVGGWWIQPDCNLPSGESFVRQGLYGQRYFQEHLGVMATVGYNVDSFGHAWTLPQILRGSGMDSYVFTRPHPHEQRLPGRVFWWESADGSRVLAYRIPYEYCTWGKEVRQYVERCAAEFRGEVDALMCFYGVGNHGGGPTRENLASIRELNEDPALPRLIFSTPSRYFAAITPEAERLPVVADELQHHASGCYAAHSGVKRWNRRTENLLISAEKLSSLAARVTGLPYPAADLRRAWKDVLFNQFHDILAGTSIESAYEDAAILYGEAMAIAARTQNGAVQSLSWQVDIPFEEGARPIVVFNPHSWPARLPVEMEFGRLRENDVLLDVEDRPVPYQRLRPEATVASGSRSRLCFVADLPAWGWSTYRVVSRSEAPPAEPAVTASATTLESDRFRLTIDEETGAIGSLYDKELNFEFARRPIGRPLVMSDRSDTWSHGVLRYDTLAGTFTPTSIRLVENGPVRATIRVDSEYGRSHLRQEFSLYRDRPGIEVRVTVDWHESFAVLKLNFPANVFFSTPTYEIPYGTIERPANGEEEPGQTWIDLTGIGRNDGRVLGLSVLNDAKYSYDAHEHEFNLTVLRSPIYAHHVPYEPQPDEEYTFTDQGIQRFTYVILPHAGNWREAGTPQRAAELNGPASAQIESAHPGPLPARAGYLHVCPETVHVTAIKEAEDGNGLILRCLETAGARTKATIELPAWNRRIEAEFEPGEIKSFLVPNAEASPIVETDLLEQPVA